MKTLLSKIQYRDFEPGEFNEAAARTFDQTIARIEGFPWEAQRLKIEIALTNPSVTMEGGQDDYLKLAVFYNGRVCAALPGY